MGEKGKKKLVVIVVAAALVLFMIPFYLLVLNTFKTTAEFTKTPFAWPRSFRFDNYAEAIRRMDFFMR
ncbi:hypothetical protein [Lachnoclostridium sp. Marseille-P6806]|uniref:hypothetical protein n=1 Tax=Lachnoclostridium sp. Marseille-P6806 TaxID=2364793 RepID=UPI00102FDFCD|nr:hypothetical protein [Lachnoclostridium sp. Marseille-P6806]